MKYRVGILGDHSVSTEGYLNGNADGTIISEDGSRSIQTAKPEARQQNWRQPPADYAPVFCRHFARPAFG